MRQEARDEFGGALLRTSCCQQKVSQPEESGQADLNLISREDPSHLLIREMAATARAAAASTTAPMRGYNGTMPFIYLIGRSS